MRGGLSGYTYDTTDGLTVGFHPHLISHTVGGDSARRLLVVRGLSVWGQYDGIVAWDSPGHLLLSSSVLSGVAGHTESVTAVKLTKGNALIESNTFTSQFQAAVDVGTGVQGAVISANHLAGNTITGADNRQNVVVQGNL